MAHLFVIDVHFVADPDQVAAAMAGHREFLVAQYEAGHFLASGGKVPRTGGVILAKGASRAEVEALIEADPLKAQGLAEYTITEFTPSRTSPELAAYVEG